MNNLTIGMYKIGDTTWEIWKDRIEDFWYLQSVEFQKISTVTGEVVPLPNYICEDYLKLYRFSSPEEAFKIWETKINDS